MSYLYFECAASSQFPNSILTLGAERAHRQPCGSPKHSPGEAVQRLSAAPTGGLRGRRKLAALGGVHEREDARMRPRRPGDRRDAELGYVDEGLSGGELGSARQCAQ